MPKNKNDINYKGFKMNKETGRYKSFIATFRNEDGKSTRKRITFNRNIFTFEEAMEEKERLMLEMDAVMRMQKFHLYKTVHGETWEELLSGFEKHLEHRVKETTAKNMKTYFINWAFPFFVKHKKENNFLLWHYHFDEFKIWLAKQDAKHGKARKISINTQNNVIRGLNSFLRFCGERFRKSIPDCKVHLNPQRKGASSLYSEQEIEDVCRFFEEKQKGASDVIRFLIATGCRLHEALGMQCRDIVLGDVSLNKIYIHEILKSRGYESYGFLTVRRQLTPDSKKGRFGPLKCRKEISDKYMRYVPIISEDFVKVLENRLIGAIKNKSILIFKDFRYHELRNWLAEFYEQSHYTKKTLHDLRHTFITNFVKLLGGQVDLSLAKDIWGHSSMKSLEVYLHLMESMDVEAMSAKTLMKLRNRGS